METSPVRASNSISCLILSFNKPEITRRCVVSCLKFFPESDIYLIHNGSLPQHQQQLHRDFPNIHHLSMAANQGYSGGVQFGLNWTLKERQYSFVFLVTNDCELEQFPPTDATLFQGQQPVFSGGQLLRRDGLLECKFGAVNLRSGRLRHLKNSPALSKNEEHYIPGHFFLMSQSAWNILQKYETSLHTYWEDVEISLRAKRLGLNLTLCDELIVRHAGGKTTRGDSYYSLFLYQRNRKRITLRYSSSKLPFRIIFFRDLSRLFFKYLWLRQWTQIQYIFQILKDAQIN